MSKTEKQHPQARIRSLVVREVADEVLVYDLQRHQAHCLNRSAASIWQSCDGQTSVVEIARLVGQETKLTMDEAMIWLALDQLGKASLLEEPVPRPVGILRLSRRDAIRKIGLGTALTLPLVTSVVAPTAIMAATPGVCADTCRHSGLGQVGSAATCDACANVPGTCFTFGNCGASGGSSFSSTCQTCAFSSWKPA